MEECNRVFVIQLSSNIKNAMCFGAEVGNSSAETIINTLAYLFGWGILTIGSIVLAWFVFLKRKLNQIWFYLIRQLKRSYGLTKNLTKLEEEEKENRKNFLTRKITVDEFGLEMLYLDRNIVKGYINNDFTLKELKSWFLRNRWDRFRDDQIMNRNTTKIERFMEKFLRITNKSTTYTFWFKQYTERIYSNSGSRDIKREDEIIVTQILNLLIESKNMTKDEVERGISKVLKENNQLKQP